MSDDTVTDAQTAADPAGNAAATGNDTVAGGAVETVKPEGTLAETGGSDKAVEAKTDWPADWRERIAGKDEDALKRLKRFTAVENVFKSYRDLEKRVSSGELKPNAPFPADGSDEDKAAWRAEQGLPAAPEAYLEALPKGLVIGEADKPLAESFAKSLHEQNLPPEAFKVGMNWYYATRDRMAAERADADKGFRAEAEDELYGKWGPEKTTNIRHADHVLFNGVIDGNGNEIVPPAPDGVREKFYSARTSEGRLFGDDPDIIAWMVDRAHALDPVGRVLPGSGGTSAQGVNDEIAALEAKMKDRRAWFGDEKAQERYRTLIEARGKMNRGRAA